MKRGYITIMAFCSALLIGSCDTSSSNEKETASRSASCWDNETPGATCKEESTNMEFVYVPGGEFLMGRGSKEEGIDDYEHHPVTVKGFWMGKYEVTQAQWEKIMGENPSFFTENTTGKSSFVYPVENVSWDDTQGFLQKLNATVETHGRASLQFRLPSEAEWEYACRAGTTTPFSFGETISTDQANYNGNYVYGDGQQGVYREQTTDVGSFPKNAFGLYDMHGNVFEWCQDTYASYSETPTDGSAYGRLDDNKEKVLRGGSWNFQPSFARCAFRLRREPAYQEIFIGFRVVVVR